jgi:hypothetical protein
MGVLKALYTIACVIVGLLALPLLVLGAFLFVCVLAVTFILYGARSVGHAILSAGK